MKCILVTLVASKFTSGIVENDPIFNRLMMFQCSSMLRSPSEIKVLKPLQAGPA